MIKLNQKETQTVLRALYTQLEIVKAAKDKAEVKRIEKILKKMGA